MPDIATIGTVLGSIKTATEIAKLIKDSGSSLEQAELKLQMAELISTLADAKIEVANIQAQLIDKEDEISKLQSLLTQKKSMVWEKPYYWYEEEGHRNGPFCQRCYDVDSKLIRLQGGTNGQWRCRACDKSFTDSSYVRPQVTRTRGMY
ncbi:hypothetical protein [uncultured Zhongshania sp.]|jgi:hypothetical protein|uniref:hypothetical protein n=1 Tax=uncultured Zhongshania sp. TaxID=1642288 RepID=UPI0025CCCF6B|nr:hypothetical protein [uncultured Zhongshania sp.]